MSRNIVITGASSGIGAALAKEYAAEGAYLLLVGRDVDRMRTVAEDVERKGARCEIALIDVTSRDDLSKALLDFDERRPIDVLIANAGIAMGGFPEPPGQARAQVEVNLLGVIDTIEPVTPRMIARGYGRIIVISSIAAIRPSADLPSYSASKAGVRAYGQAIRSALSSKGVSVTVVCPGFVTSPMSARHHGPKPFEIPAEKAARIIARGAQRKRGALTFPWPFALMIFLGNRLPPSLSDWFERRYAARIGD